MKVIKGILLLSIALLFSGCLSLSTSVNIREDNSGTINLVYEISRIFADMGRIDEDDPVYPLPVGEEDFQDTILQVPGLSLNSWESEITEDMEIIRVELGFDNFEALNGYFATLGDSGVAFTSGEERGVDIQILRSESSQYGQEAEELLTSFFSGMTLSLRVQTPSPLSSVSPADFQQGEDEFYLEIPLVDYMKNTEDRFYNARW